MSANRVAFALLDTSEYCGLAHGLVGVYADVNSLLADLAPEFPDKQRRASITWDHENGKPMTGSVTVSEVRKEGWRVTTTEVARMRVITVPYHPSRAEKANEKQLALEMSA